jgi:peptidoglycan/LPS O-acetylase OafA/YrhL
MRIKAIDLLRAFAILGVLFRHSSINNWFARAGWAGVDLFFVLSGFLVSGLLFYELKKSGNVNIKRFLIRRGFKIYPAFYVFLIVSILLELYVFNNRFAWKNILSEVLFMQSYFEGCFMHTWSLSIEEHFYILLSFFILLTVQQKWIYNSKLMIGFLLGFIILVFTMRFQYVSARINEPSIHFFQTHLRMDGLLIGVLVSYLYYFTHKFKDIINLYFIPLLLTSIALMILPFVFSAGSYFMLTTGLTAMQIGFGIFVAIIITVNDKIEAIKYYNTFLVNILSLIGRYSYSIYLWHLLLYKILLTFWQKEPPVIIYFLVTIIGGICLSLIIEQVFLKIRDKYFAPVVVLIK